MVGCGNMGGAMLQAWMAGLALDVTVAKPTPARVPDAARYVDGAERLAGERFDAVVIGVKPQMIADVMPAYRDMFAEDGLLVSLAAGTTCAYLGDLLAPPATARLMPNMPARIARGVTGVYCDAAATPAHRSLAMALAEAAGRGIACESEDGLDRLTAVAGCGPGYVFEFARAWVEGAKAALGFTEAQARAMVLETLRGSAELALADDAPLEEHRNAIMSKKGATAAGVAALRERGEVEARIRAAMEAAYARTLELRG